MTKEEKKKIFKDTVKMIKDGGAMFLWNQDEGLYAFGYGKDRMDGNTHVHGLPDVWYKVIFRNNILSWKSFDQAGQVARRGKPTWNNFALVRKVPNLQPSCESIEEAQFTGLQQIYLLYLVKQRCARSGR